MIKKEYITKGMRIRHPSGQVTTTTLEDLKKVKEFNDRSIEFFKKQNEDVENDIARIEKRERL